MAQVELAAAAVADIDRLILSHSLPEDTKPRLKQALKMLGRFPLIGPELSGRWAGLRFILGPWRWMLVVYVYFEDDERVVIVTIQDARSSSAATATRGH